MSAVLANIPVPTGRCRQRARGHHAARRRRSLPPFDASICRHVRRRRPPSPRTAPRCAPRWSCRQPPRWLRQVHGIDVLDADAPAARWRARRRRRGRRAARDGVLAVLTADCLPVLFCADDGTAVAAAHAGWRGLAGGVLEAAVARSACRRARCSPGSVRRSARGPTKSAPRSAPRSCAQDAAAARRVRARRARALACDLCALARQRLAARRRRAHPRRRLRYASATRASIRIGASGETAGSPA